MKLSDYISTILYKKRCITEYIKHDLLKINEKELEK